MRNSSGALALVLASGGVKLWMADLFTVTLQDGATTFYWTTFDTDLVWSGNTFKSQSPWLTRSQWNVAMTMAVPELDLTLNALNDGFNGGVDIKAQITNGLFDGATLELNRVFMPTPGDTSTLGAVLLFGGEFGDIDIDGIAAKIKVKGLPNKLDINAPQHVYQAGCIHSFCDSGCTLLRSSFTASYVVGTSPTRYFIPWASAPGSPALYNGGTLKFTSGVNSGQSRTIQSADSSGLTLAYPLYNTPSAGDGFTAFQGCDKQFTTCTSRSNTQHWRGYPTVPPVNTAY